MAGRSILINALSLSAGGGRSYVINLIRELNRDRRGFSFELIGLEEAFRDLDVGSVPISWVNIPRRPRAARVPARILYEQILLPHRARQFDLLYCLADLVPLVCQTPCVVLARNLNIYDRRWYDDRRTRMLARLGQAGMSRATRILFPTRAAADQIAALATVPAERIRVVHYGISIEVFADLPPPTADTPYLFLPAAVERHKNIATLVRALPLCREPGLQLWVAGESKADPEHQRELEGLARDLGIAERVRFLGAVPYQEILRFYRGARALVFPSFIETFGHPLLEAMAAGTPVIASDIPAFREIAEDAALFFPVDDPRSLAARVDELMSEQKATQRRIAQGRMRAESFTWSRSVDALCAVFEEVLRRE